MMAQVLESLPLCSISQGLPTTLGWGQAAANPLILLKGYKPTSPGASNCKIRISGSLYRLLRDWKAPSRDALSVSSPEVGEPTETGWGWGRVGKLVQTQGMESYSPNLPEPSSGQLRTRSIPSPTHSPPPTTHPARRPDSARSRAARRGSHRPRCRRMQRGGTREYGHSRKFPAGRLGPISTVPARPAPAAGPRPANRDPRFTRRKRGGF